ncbi:hypothetical protein KEM54_002455 [Ascosphaera aggregata]|nr:hypothetical protein KEM54_002455 [Ascosphaera aggregata]
MVLKLTFNKPKPGDSSNSSRPPAPGTPQSQQSQPQSQSNQHQRPSPASSASRSVRRANDATQAANPPKLKLKFGPAPSHSTPASPSLSAAASSKGKHKDGSVATGARMKASRTTPQSKEKTKAVPRAPSLKLKKPKAPSTSITQTTFATAATAGPLSSSFTASELTVAGITAASTAASDTKSKKRPRAELKLSAPKRPPSGTSLNIPTTISVKPPAPPPPPPPAPAPQIKRIRFNAKPPPAIRLKSKGEPPRRPKGVGYDSEASDAEIDPALEEEFILRMQPGDDCEYLRKAIEEKRFGPPSRGGADVSFKALTRDGRRSVVTIRGHVYAATLVDLPCIIEAMKSWDKRGWYKSADICQMLLVLGRVANEEEAKTFPLPKDIDPTSWQFAHGLTPPLRWVRKRRFRKRISNRTIETVELEVARLLKEDMEAIEPPDFEVLDYAQYMREEEEATAAAAAAATSAEQYGDIDAEGEVDYMDYQTADTDGVAAGGDPFEDAFAAEMEAALAAHAEESGEPGITVEESATNTAQPTAPPVAGVQPPAGAASGTTTSMAITAAPGQAPPELAPVIKQEYETEEIGDLFGDDEDGSIGGTVGQDEGTVSGTPAPPTVAGTPTFAPSASAENDTSDDEDDDDEDDDEEEDAYLDEATLERQRQMKEAQEEIIELEARIAEETRRWEALTNPILKGKLGRSIMTLKQELELKRVLVGQGGQ